MGVLTRKSDYSSHREAAFIGQRIGMAVLAFLFPTVFIASWLMGRTELQLSLSAYYWTLNPERDFFVAALFAIGLYLVLYKGYTLFEDAVLLAAGVCAMGVAFIPTGEGASCTADLSLHGILAVVFFACIAFICFFMSKISLRDEPDPDRKRLYMRLYGAVSILMGVSVGAAVGMRFLPEDLAWRLCERSWTLICESGGVYAFAAFWLIKTLELRPRRKQAERALAALRLQAA
jgi:hypothetical protein